MNASKTNPINKALSAYWNAEAHKTSVELSNCTDNIILNKYLDYTCVNNFNAGDNEQYVLKMHTEQQLWRVGKQHAHAHAISCFQIFISMFERAR